MRLFTEYPPLSLYVHFPWCVQKCPYCDFNSHTAPAIIPEREYIEALTTDLEQHAPDIWGRAVQSVFFGGGTPSLLSAEGFDVLLGKIRALVKLEPDAEITVEANPGTVEQSRFQAYRDAGANRLSIGVQSFNDKQLTALGRIHGRQEAIQACHSAAAAGFDHFNIDLMHGLPDQSAEAALSDVETALSLSPTHVSYYQLTIEPNTLFAAKPPVLPDEELLWTIQQQGKQALTDAGFRQYEVSAYAKDRRQCRHNLNYWLFGDYLGIGAGAHSKLSFPAHNKITRISKHKHPKTYLQSAATAARIQEQINVSETDSRFEFLMNALRLNSGFTPSEFLQRTGEPVSVVMDKLALAEQRGLIKRTIDKITPTELGLRYLDSLLNLFLDPSNTDTRKTIPITPAGN